MGIKKIARPINKAKNSFLKWLKDNKADNIEDDEGVIDNEWDYYRSVSGFVNDKLYMVYFMMWHGKINIDYSDEKNRHEKLSINEFLEMLGDEYCN